MNYLNAVPSHVRYLVFVTNWHEALDLCIEDAETIHIALFRVATHQLLTDADAQDRLIQGNDNLVEAALTQVVHGTGSLALSGEDDPVCAAQFLGGISQQGFNPHPLQSVNDGEDIPCIVFHYGNLHATPTFSLLLFRAQRYNYIFKKQNYENQKSPYPRDSIVNKKNPAIIQYGRILL